MQCLLDIIAHIGDIQGCAAQGRGDPDRFLQCAILGTDVLPLTHLIVPTNFGLPLDPHRIDAVDAMCGAAKNTSDRICIRASEDTLNICALCHAALKPLHCAHVRPYQVALHVMGGQRDQDTEWVIDMCCGLLCRHCSTASVPALVVPPPSAMDTWIDALRISVFNALIQPGPFDFLESDNLDEQVQHMALLFFERLLQITSWTRILRWRRDDACDHCGRRHGTVDTLQTCVGCGVLRYCPVVCDRVVRLYHYARTTCPVMAAQRPVVADERRCYYLALHDPAGMPLVRVDRHDCGGVSE